MSERTITVTAPVSDGTGGGGSYGGYNPGGSGGMVAGQAISMMVNSINNGDIEKTCAIVAKAAKDNKFQILLDNFRQSVFFDNALSGGQYKVYDWLTNASLRKSYQINQMGDNLSGSAWSVFSAMSNFFWGNGRPMNVDIKNIGLNIQAHKIPGFQNEISSYSNPGIYNLSYKFAYNTGNDSVVAGLYLGNITLNMTGTFTRNTDGTWILNANVRGFQDTYDFNASSHRSTVNENLTTAWRYLENMFKGKPFQININGNYPLKLSGK